jgi:hypothetical protein
MPIRPTARLRSLLAMGLLVCALPACTHSDIAHESFFRLDRSISVTISGEAPAAGAPVAVDIQNHAGSVIVEIDDRLEAPVIEAGVLRPRDAARSAMPETDAHGAISAVYIPSADAGSPSNASTLRIAARLDESYPADAGVALRVRVPRCDGLNIANNAGPIVILGTDGAVTAQNGTATGEGGRIEFRTSHPLRDPVALITTQGRISAVIDPEGAGTFELDTERGQSIFGSAYGTQTGVAPGVRSYRGTWNGGRNPFVARTGDGDIQVFVKPEAEQYSTADDWMALFFD